ncbi:hypothetical protein L2D08_03890 [Domibacillus sp. PGB-M46]|uniref:hypothetical protein n=1 Tax=Domibacillus sp. PGB-M46 TaxID=2910255 RepID=UPI001F57F9BD|nr:hypothetical protein [Domibacillus sp. PGB-M46]MCI2253503.1 hypothetical protein [Domibacillus sp. PGB-M46]
MKIEPAYNASMNPFISIPVLPLMPNHCMIGERKEDEASQKEIQAEPCWHRRAAVFTRSYQKRFALSETALKKNMVLRLAGREVCGWLAQSG